MRIPKDAPKGTPLKRFESGIRNGKYDAKELNKNEESLNQFIKEVIQGLKKISDDFKRGLLTRTMRNSGKPSQKLRLTKSSLRVMAKTELSTRLR